jgi:capsular polysaccharide biosynthesis protein
MELILIFRVLVRWWWVVVIPVVVAAIFVVPDLLRESPATSGGFNVTLRYSAAQVASNLVPRDGDYQDVWLASELTVNALTDWVRSGSFRDEIRQQLETNGSEIDLGALGVAADNKRSIGQLSLSYPDADQLAAITEAAIVVLKGRAQTYFPQLGNEPAAVTILDTPQVVPAPPPLANRFAPLIRLAVALLGGILLAFLVEYLDPTLRRREQVEALGLPVIGSIPRQ